jgi:hypothetical protein
MAPIRCDDGHVQLAMEFFPYQVVQFPLKYLGLPLSLGKLPKSVWQPLVDKAADRLPIWKGSMMNCSDRFALIKSTLSAIPLYTSIGLGLPGWVQKALEKIMKAFLWTGTDTIQAGKCLVVWSSIQQPLHHGGLGILDLKLFSTALRLRWLWLSQTDSSRAWSAFPVKEDQATTAFFYSSISIIVGDGKSVLFWLDHWLDGKSIADLVASVPQRRRNKTSVAMVLQGNAWVRDITGPCTIPVMAQYLAIRQWLDNFVLHQDYPDRFVWKWCPSGTYSASSAYSAFFHGQTVILGAKELWNTKAPNNCRFFGWLILHGRCWTADRRQRHGLQDSAACALCSQGTETIDHLLLGCVFAHEVWYKVLRCCGW